MKTYQIRYNTTSTSDKDKWRLIEDGVEKLVSNIHINGHVYTSEDFVNVPTERFPHIFPIRKWHISCKGKCEIKDGTAYIDAVSQKDSSILRHTLKTISYRFLGTLTTFVVSYVTTGSVVFASTIGFTELMIKPVLYFIHERIWYKFVKFKK